MLLLTGEGIGQKGEGIARNQGMPVFVPGLLPGEEAKVRLTERRSSYFRGEITELLKPSRLRCIPFCEYFGECGGCHLQHLEYESSLEWKRESIVQVFRRQGHMDVSVNPVLPSPETHGIRNKVQLPVAGEGRSLRTGFYAPRSHRFIPIESCPVQSPLANRLLQHLNRLLADLSLSSYNESCHSGLLRHVILRTSRDDDQAQIVLVVNGDGIPNSDKLISGIVPWFPEVQSILMNINTGKGNAVMGDKARTLWGKPYMCDRIGEYSFRISHGSFFQTNRFLSETLYTTALQQSGISSLDTVVELYCGVGTITTFLSAKAAAVWGVEVSDEAVMDAIHNVQTNGFSNFHFRAGTAEAVLPNLIREGLSPDMLLVDPPRRGCDSSLLWEIIQAKIPKILYISCNPATLVRDAVHLCSAGYRLSTIQPYDMFPWTEHIECSCCFSLPE